MRMIIILINEFENGSHLYDCKHFFYRFKMNKKILLSTCISLLLFSNSNAADVYAPAVTVTGGAEEADSLSGSGTYIGSDSIQSNNYDSIDQVLKQIPGVYTRSENGYGIFPNISLRGVDPGRSQKITIMEDGVLSQPAPYTDFSAYFNPTTGNKSGIEVLMGSSQVLYGPRTTGGVLNYLTTPIPTKRRAFLKTTYGNYFGVLGSRGTGGPENLQWGNVRTHGYYGDTFNTNIGEFGALLEIYGRGDGGFRNWKKIDKGQSGFHKYEPMVKLSYKPNTSLEQSFELKAQHIRMIADLGYGGASKDDLNNGDPWKAYGYTQMDRIWTERIGGHLKYNVEIPKFYDTKVTTTAYASKFRRDWAKAAEYSTTLNDTDGGTKFHTADTNTELNLIDTGGASGITVESKHNNRAYRMRGVEVKAVSGFDTDFGGTNLEHTLTYGTRWHYDSYYDASFYDYYNLVDSRMYLTSSTEKEAQSQKEYKTWGRAFYVQDAIQHNNLTVTPGFRYEKVDAKRVRSGTSGLLTQDIEGYSGGIGFNYKQSNNLAFFGSVHHGSSFPKGADIFATADGDTENMDPETSFAKELGLRYKNTDKGFNSKIALFHTDFEDLIVSSNTGAGSAVTQNAGEVESMGMELSASYDLGFNQGWSFNNPWTLAFTYTDSEFQNDAKKSDGDTIFGNSKKGNDLPYISNYQVTIGTDVINGPASFGIVGNWRSSQWSSGENVSVKANDTRIGKVPARWIWDFKGSYKLRNNIKYDFGVHNVFNAKHIETFLPLGPRPGAPLQAYFGITYDY